jgi:hypothetical protein
VVGAAKGCSVGFNRHLGIVILLAAITIDAQIAQLTSDRFWLWGIFKLSLNETGNNTKDTRESNYK